MVFHLKMNINTLEKNEHKYIIYIREQWQNSHTNDIFHRFVCFIENTQIYHFNILVIFGLMQNQTRLYEGTILMSSAFLAIEHH